MNNILLVTRPKYDDGTEYLSYYASLVIKEAENIDFQVKDFEGDMVEQGGLLKYLKIKNPFVIFINGHGDENSLYGYKDKVLFNVNQDLLLLQDKIIYARACSAGAVLGKKIVDGNNGCFLGYKQPFCFWIDSKWSAKPSNDNIARLYLEPSNKIMESIIKGKTIQEANEKSKKQMIENMKKMLLMEKNKEPGAMNMIQVLWNNFEGQIVHGNSMLKVRD